MERLNSFASDQIVITKRQASMMMASMLLFCLFVFIVGFFLGKRSAIDDFSSKVSQDALHDQIDFLLTTQSLQSSQDEQAQKSLEFSSANFEDTDDTPLLSIPTEKANMPVAFVPEKTMPTVMMQAEKQVVTIHNEQPQVESSFVQSAQYAQLIGFGTKKAAQAFVNRLKKHHVHVVLKTMVSKTALGKERIWYQAITPTYQTAQELREQVAKIKKLEHIRDTDIKIVYIK